MGTVRVPDFASFRAGFYDFGRVVRDEKGKLIGIVEKKDATPEQLEIKEAAEDYQNKQGWDKYKDFLLTIGTVAFCVILVGATIYFTYKFAGGGTTAINNLADAIRNAGVIPGR